MKRNKEEIMKARRETLATFRKVDDTVRTLVYQGSYGLDEMLEKGISGVTGVIRFAHRFFRSRQVYVNPFVRDFGCSSFNTRTPGNDFSFSQDIILQNNEDIVYWY